MMPYDETTSKLLDKIIELKSSTKEGFWQHVDFMLAFLYKEYPLEMIELEHDAKAMRDLSKNKFHSNTDKSAREIGVIPYRLYTIIMKLYDQGDMPFKTDAEFRRAFMKKYKQFSYAESI